MLLFNFSTTLNGLAKEVFVVAGMARLEHNIIKTLCSSYAYVTATGISNRDMVGITISERLTANQKAL